jgi:hypothetical protein
MDIPWLTFSDNLIAGVMQGSDQSRTGLLMFGKCDTSGL